MTLLLDDRFAPITSNIGFLETDLDAAVDAFVRWEAAIQRPRGVTLTTRPLAGSLPELLAALPPLTSVEARRFLFVATRGRWVAFFDNGHRGSDPTGPMAYLARSCGWRALRVAAIPHHAPKLIDGRWRGRYGATILDLFGPEVIAHSNRLRSICSINDGGRWTFEEWGTPLPFEQPHVAARVRDRFPVERLARYLDALGISAFDERFYREEAVLVEKQGPTATGLKSFSLESIRSEL